jgi:D-3-phosphoglycerate dehydrogenase
MICVEIRTDKGDLEVWGTVFAKNDLRIVRLNKFHVEAHPKGYLLVIKNKDLPGVVGQIGTIMGKNKINIAEMTFGREKLGGQAVSVLNVDSEISKPVLEEIKKCDNIYDAKIIHL